MMKAPIVYDLIMLGGIFMLRFIEIGFQILNTAILIAIPVVIYKAIKNYTVRRTSIDDRISNLENRVKELENK